MRSTMKRGDNKTKSTRFTLRQYPSIEDMLRINLAEQHRLRKSKADFTAIALYT